MSYSALKFWYCQCIIYWYLMWGGLLVQNGYVRDAISHQSKIYHQRQAKVSFIYDCIRTKFPSATPPLGYLTFPFKPPGGGLHYAVGLKTCPRLKLDVHRMYLCKNTNFENFNENRYFRGYTPPLKLLSYCMYKTRNTHICHGYNLHNKKLL